MNFKCFGSEDKGEIKNSLIQIIRENILRII